MFILHTTSVLDNGHVVAKSAVFLRYDSESLNFFISESVVYKQNDIFENLKSGYDKL